MKETPDKKAAALKATLELISEQGFHGTPMSQIAQRANIGVGTIYRYFDSKEDLINELYIDLKARLTRYVVRDYSEGMPVHEGFILLFRNVIRYFIDHPAELLFLEQYENSPLITPATREASLRMVGAADNLFARAIEQKLLKELPAEVMGALISGAVSSLAKLYLSGAVQLDEDTLTAGLEAIWDAIKR